MHSYNKENKNIKIKFYCDSGFVSGRNRSSYFILPLFFVSGLIILTAGLTPAIAQPNINPDNLSNNILKITEEHDTEISSSLENNSYSNSTFAEPNPNPDSIIPNVTLGSYSSFIDDINSQIRSESSNSYPVINTSSSSSSSQTQKQTGNLSNLLNLKEIVIQNTSMSIPAPVKHPGQPTHEVVFALPLRNDGHIWTGTVTFTASKPIEVEVLHIYAPLEKPDSFHGEPYYAILPGNNSVAISHLRHLVDIPIEINGTGISSGTLNFAGNALVFHKTTGEPFTVTYTIDAAAKKLTQLDK